MDDPDGFAEGANGFHEEVAKTRQLPADLPKSLDDRQPVRTLGNETEMYDAWQGRVRNAFKNKQIIHAHLSNRSGLA